VHPTCRFRYGDTRADATRSGRIGGKEDGNDGRGESGGEEECFIDGNDDVRGSKWVVDFSKVGKKNLV